MRKILGLLLAAVITAFILPATSYGKTNSGFPTVGERAQAMGNAFVAVANDASAIYWNPAGLALIKRRQAQISHTDLYGVGIDYNFLGYAQPMYGAAWAHIDSGSFLMGGGDYSQDMYIIAGARQVDPQTYVGASIKWHQQKYAPPATVVGTASSAALSGDGFSMDVGLLYMVDQATTVGAAVQDLFGELRTKNSNRSVNGDSLDPDISVGFSRQSDPESLYSIQVSRLGEESTVHFGFEKKLQPELVLRAGLDDEVVTAGFGFTRNEWQLNYSFKNKTSIGLDRTQRFGAVVQF
ncbi:MAG TPA: hypothetical protein PLQ76_05895 [bacterium]|nr:hypothetical protein [bacterium]